MPFLVHLFAVARERAGSSIVEVDLSSGATVSDLKELLAVQFPALSSILPSSRLAVDSEYADDATPIPPGAELALIPPVSGGSEG